VIDGVAKIIKTGADVYEGLIVGVVVVLAVAFSQTEGRSQRSRFFAGGLGLTAAVNLALFLGAMAILVGPTLLEGKTSLDGPLLGLWAGVSVLAVVLVLRSRLAGLSRRIAAGLLLAAIVALFYGLDRGVPAYRAYAATSAVQAAGGTVKPASSGGLVVDLSGSQLDDAALRQVLERLRYLPDVRELSLARTHASDASVSSLKGLTSLNRLDLSGTKVSNIAKTMLGRALPDLDITE
jgi:hypothetical protein